jgi:hypothetical protein
MKHFLITLFAFFFFNTSFGQPQKDNWLLMGAGSFYAFKQDATGTNLIYYTRELNASFLSSIGYFVKDKFVIGIENRLNAERNKLIVKDIGIKNFRCLLDLFFRYNFLPDKNFNFLLTLIIS